MVNGYGRGIGNGLGRGIGTGRGAAFSRGIGIRRGMGLGFRGSSPPWPYVGLGRGGLPRCGYYYGNTVVPTPPLTGAQSNYRNFTVPMSKDEELNQLKNQAEMVKEELDNIESRMRSLETKE
ncbi:MAG: DUF5320 domain-containing protein [Dehalococcoidales bacterium]|nr:DUF5320 domain-containing protein [Dehalococcoidales bacterium]